MTDWNELPDHVQEDLLEWFNIAREAIDDDDRARLARLFDSGEFFAWDCAMCGTRCQHAYPDDWSWCQGVCEQDYTSFPGDSELFTPEMLAAMCNSCRMTGAAFCNTNGAPPSPVTA